jgi:hypothetical protein
VAWRHRIALVVLIALAGMPVGGAACAFMCDSASALKTAHHGTHRTCAEPAPSSPGPQMSGASGHGCSAHDASIRPVATTAAERADLSAKSAPSVVGTTANTVVTLHDTQFPFDYTAPPGTAPPTTRPDVLRV